MARLTEDQRRALKRTAARERERADARANGVYSIDDVRSLAQETELGWGFQHVPWRLVIGTDVLACENCFATLKVVHFYDEDRLCSKTWRCTNCRVTYRGFFKRYMIQEWPG